MALRAVFVGINKHRDPGIPELTGATKDATAVWALFKDSVEGIADERLLDDQATAASIRTALDASLGLATEDDTITAKERCPMGLAPRCWCATALSKLLSECRQALSR